MAPDFHMSTQLTVVDRAATVLVRIAVFLASIYVRRENFAFFFYEQPDRYWHIGPLFGLVVVVWHAASLRALCSLRSGAFLLASTLILGVVGVLSIALPFLVASTLMSLGVESHAASSFGMISAHAAYVLGTALLPLAHAGILKTSWTRVRIAIPSIYVAWFLVSLPIGWLNFKFDLHFDQVPLGPLLNPVYIWQACYLVFMFGRLPKRKAYV